MITKVSVVLRDLGLVETQLRGTSPVGGAQRSVFVRVIGDSGLSGCGEASSWPLFSEQTPAAVADVIAELLAPLVVGTDEFDRSGTRRVLDEALPGNAVAKAALDTAVLDLAGKVAGVPARALLGGSRDVAIDLSYSVSKHDPREIREIVKAKQDNGYRIFKLKVGVLDARADADRLLALRDAAPEALLRLDYNQRADERRLRTMLGPARDVGLDFCEQPFRARQFDRLERLRTWFDVPISLDESIGSPDELDEAARRGVCDVVALKFGRVGGSERLVDMIRIAERYGIGVYCGALNETRLGIAVSAHAFSVAGQLVPGSDFYFPYEVLDDTGVEGGLVREGTTLRLSTEPGHGARLPDDWFTDAREVEESR